MVQFLDGRDDEETVVEDGDSTVVEDAGVRFLADSKQPKDVFQQLDSTVRDMSKRFSKEPYTSTAYQFAIQNIPNIDPLTKTKLAQGDTEHFKEVYGIPALHFLNQYLFNYPRSTSASLGLEFPESKTPVGTVLSKGAGVAGAVKQFQTGLGVAKKVLPFKALAGATGIKTAARGAVAGAAQGALLSPKDPLDFKSRAQQAGIGAVLGGLLAPVSNKIANFIKKKKVRGQTNLKGRVARNRANADLNRTTRDIRGDQTIDEANSLLQQSQKELQDTVAIQQVRGKVPDLKVASVKHGKNLNRLYETTVNDISEEIGETTTTLGASDFFKQFADDIGVDEGLRMTTAFKRIQSFSENIDDNMSFGKLNSLRHQVTKKVYRGDVDDVVYTQFRRAFNEFAETVDTTGKFAQLNKTMAPQLDFKSAFNKKINTFKKYETKGAEDLVKKYARRNLEPEKITQGEITLMDDAMKYLGKYGVKTSDVESIYSGRAKDLAKVQSVSNKLAEATKQGGIVEKGRKAVSKSIRTKQNARIGEIDIAQSKRLVSNAINTVIRLSLAGMALNAFHEFKKGAGLSNDAQQQSDFQR